MTSRRFSGEGLKLFRMNDLDILEATEDYCVLNKPGGVLTQGPPGVDSIELRLRRWRSEVTGEAHPYIGIPHRLDRPVSGVMVCGLTPKATQRLGEQFQSREVQKTYWGIVAGEVQPDLGRWTDFMRKVPDEARSEIVASEDAGAQIAILNFRVLRRGGGAEGQCSWLQIDLETGRTHQIRLQAASRGYPLDGDELYGSQRAFGPSCVDTRERWIALHARQLKFYDHRRRERRTFSATPSSWWDEVLNRLGLSAWPAIGEG